MYQHSKTEVFTRKLSKVTAQTGQTETRPNVLPQPCLQVVRTMIEFTQKYFDNKNSLHMRYDTNTGQRILNNLKRFLALEFDAIGFRFDLFSDGADDLVAVGNHVLEFAGCLRTDKFTEAAAILVLSRHGVDTLRQLLRQTLLSHTWHASRRRFCLINNSIIQREIILTSYSLLLLGT